MRSFVMNRVQRRGACMLRIGECRHASQIEYPRGDTEPVERSVLKQDASAFSQSAHPRLGNIQPKLPRPHYSEDMEGLLKLSLSRAAWTDRHDVGTFCGDVSSTEWVTVFFCSAVMSLAIYLWYTRLNNVASPELTEQLLADQASKRVKR